MKIKLKTKNPRHRRTPLRHSASQRRVSLRLRKSPPRAGQPAADKIQIVFIGAGNMTEAMVRGILKTGLYRPDNILVTDIDVRRRDFFQRELGITGSADNKEAAAATASAIVFAVKPQQAPQVFAELRENLPNNPLLISIVTGFSIKKIMAALGEAPRGKPRGIFAEPCEAKNAISPCGSLLRRSSSGYEGREPQGFLAKKGQPVRIIRVVPNTPALVGSGVSAYCCSKGTTNEDERLAESILKSVGTVIRLDEPLLNAATALSGSGPAYVFYLVEALLKAGQELGLTEATARRLIVATVAGSARLLSETGLPPAELRQRVTSRGGTTEAAMEILNKGKTRQTIIAAVKAAHKRARKLSA